MGQVAIFWEVHANKYVMPTSMVFFWDHVSAEDKVGTGMRPRKIHDTTRIPKRTAHEMGPLRTLGKGNPDENKPTSNLILNKAKGLVFQLGFC
jgi:hypothetical protein